MIGTTCRDLSGHGRPSVTAILKAHTVIFNVSAPDVPFAKPNTFLQTLRTLQQPQSLDEHVLSAHLGLRNPFGFCNQHAGHATPSKLWGTRPSA